MRLTDEMVERDDARYAGRNGLAEIKYLGREVCHRKAITNDDIRFMAWAFRFADAEIERLKNAMVETGSIHCPCSPDCGDDCEKCVDSAIEETLKAKPPKSAWIHRADMDYKDKNGVVHFHGMCESCGFIHDFIDGHTGQYKFCPECGSKNEQWDGDGDG